MPAVCGTLCNCHCLNCRQGEGRVVIHQFQFKVDFILIGILLNIFHVKNACLP